MPCGVEELGRNNLAWLVCIHFGQETDGVLWEDEESGSKFD